MFWNSRFQKPTLKKVFGPRNHAYWHWKHSSWPYFLRVKTMPALDLRFLFGKRQSMRAPHRQGQW